ncbi:hypothetical protein [Sinomonas susongensis]|uniref:hypothetical protein n=1 Tax=Sinomonas susongensis TaxID=1324851 RepID=UPI001107C3A2|nr:hypothetical protein [Sinomonas susongensis]
MRDEQLAVPAYRTIMARLRDLQQRGSPQQRVEAEMWQPIAANHRPSGQYTGQPCSKCGDPWPCLAIREMVAGGFVPPMRAET